MENTVPLFHGPRAAPVPEFRPSARCRRLLSRALLVAVLAGLSACSKSSPQPTAAEAAPVPPPAQASPSRRELSEEDARRILPRADLSGLTGEARAQFLDIAGDVFDYAGCKDTLAKCLAADVKDAHTAGATLELGAGTLNQLAYEPAGHAYDIVEPFKALYSDSPLLGGVRHAYADIVRRPQLPEPGSMRCPGVG